MYTIAVLPYKRGWKINRFLRDITEHRNSKIEILNPEEEIKITFNLETERLP